MAPWGYRSTFSGIALPRSRKKAYTALSSFLALAISTADEFNYSYEGNVSLIIIMTQAHDTGSEQQVITKHRGTGRFLSL